MGNTSLDKEKLIKFFISRFRLEDIIQAEGKMTPDESLKMQKSGAEKFNLT